jgi:hypothetical protein
MPPDRAETATRYQLVRRVDRRSDNFFGFWDPKREMETIVGTYRAKLNEIDRMKKLDRPNRRR